MSSPRYPLELLNQFFYDGLTQACQAVVDNAAGGAMGEKTAQETYELYEMLGANSQQKSVRGKARGMYEVNSNTELAIQVTELAKQVKSMCTLMMGQASSSSIANEACAVCGNHNHMTMHCPANEQGVEYREQAHSMNSYNQRQNNPYSNTYNPGWRNHPNFSWNNGNTQGQPPNQNIPP